MDEPNAVKLPCQWCHDKNKPLALLEWSVIDDNFGQYVHRDLIHYCFHCGRKLGTEKEAKDG